MSFKKMYHRHFRWTYNFFKAVKTSLGPVLPAFLSATDHSIRSISTELGEAPFTVTALKSRFEPDLPRNPSSGEAVLVKFPNANTCDMCCLRGTDLPHL